MQLNIIIIILTCILIIILTFYLVNKQEKFETNNINLKLAIQVVLIIKENIPYLREWIIYHLNLGVDKIYLYDNTGSIGFAGSDKNKNKYNIKYAELINLTDKEVDRELQNILNEYKDNVVYVR